VGGTLWEVTSGLNLQQIRLLYRSILGKSFGSRSLPIDRKLYPHSLIARLVAEVCLGSIINGVEATDLDATDETTSGEEIEDWPLNRRFLWFRGMLSDEVSERRTALQIDFTQITWSLTGHISLGSMGPTLALALVTGTWR